MITEDRFLRPAELSALCGDSRKAGERLGWTPKTSFPALVLVMIENDPELASHEKTINRTILLF